MLREEHAVRVITPPGTCAPYIVGPEALSKISASYREASRPRTAISAMAARVPAVGSGRRCRWMDRLGGGSLFRHRLAARPDSSRRPALLRWGCQAGGKGDRKRTP